MEKTITAKEIHEDFFKAEERLYVEAIGLSKGGLVTKNSKAERLKKIGFGRAKPIADNEQLEKRRAVSGHMIRVIEYFRTYYPQNKFITEDEVKKLCAKYSLLLGETGNFIADMPEKNLVEIEKFKLRKEDWAEKSKNIFEAFQWFAPSRQPETDTFGFIQTKSRRSGRTSDYTDLLAEYLFQRDSLSKNLGIPTSREGYASGVDPYAKEEKKEYEQPAFKICAPKEDFYTSGYEIRDGYRLVYDPIVLQPVSREGIEGYLIVTAWGDEASDELVNNPATN